MCADSPRRARRKRKSLKMTKKLPMSTHTQPKLAVKPRTKRLDELTKAIVGVGKPGEGGRGFVHGGRR